MENSLVLTAYLIYLPIVIGLTLVVAQVLFKNGLFFMLDIFHGKEDIAIATNQLFKIGFYLLNLGFAFMIIQLSSYRVKEIHDVVEVLSTKVGGFSIYLGVSLFFILLIMLRGRKNARRSMRKRNGVEDENYPIEINNDLNQNPAM